MKKETVSAQVVLKSIEKKSKPFINKLAKITSISNLDELDNAGTMLKTLKDLGGEAEVQEKTITDPLNQAMKATRELFKPLKNLIQEEDIRIKKMILAYHEKQEDKVKKLEQDFSTGKIKSVTALVSKQDALKVSSHSSSIRKVWKAVAVDEKKTPREFLVPNEAAIHEALKQGKKVSGWEFRQINSVAV